MTCRMAELQYKELVDITDGTRYGFIGDLEIDLEQGSIKNLIVYGRPRALGLLGREADAVFPWHAVKRIGADLILIDSNCVKNEVEQKIDEIPPNFLLKR